MSETIVPIRRALDERLRQARPDRTGAVLWPRAARSSSPAAAPDRRSSPPVSRSPKSPTTPASPRSSAAGSRRLHPKIHGGILARRDEPDDLATLERQGFSPIDLVVVNLYPFEATVARPGATWAEAIENIDIGGPTLDPRGGQEPRARRRLDQPRPVRRP